MSRKPSRSRITDEVWNLWNSYDSSGENEEENSWGYHKTDSQEEKDAKEHIVVRFENDLKVPREVTERVLGRISYSKECSILDEREVNQEVRDWSKLVYASVGRSGGPEEVKALREKVESLIDSLPSKAYINDPSMKKAEKALVDLGIPSDIGGSLLWYGFISRKTSTPEDKKYQDSRKETYESLLQEGKYFVKR